MVLVEVSSERRTFLTFTVFELSDVTLKPIQSGTEFDLSSTDIRFSLYLKSSTEPNYADFDMVKPLNLQGDTTFTYLTPGTWFILISSSETSTTTVRIGFESAGIQLGVRMSDLSINYEVTFKRWKNLTSQLKLLN